VISVIVRFCVLGCDAGRCTDGVYVWVSVALLDSNESREFYTSVTMITSAMSNDETNRSIMDVVLSHKPRLEQHTCNSCGRT
jgi:hypothetical protein